MRILILGATGMLGHKLLQTLAGAYEAVGTVRGDAASYAAHPVLGGLALRGGVHAEDPESVARVLADVQPGAVINAIGLVKQLKEAQDPVACITINALFPHRLARQCRAAGARLVHISTDCVFSGRKGRYTEDDFADAEDLYGRTKYLGEVGGPGCLTLRTSVIGRELSGHTGLLDWFIRQRGGRIRGYARAIYSGFTTRALAALIGDVLRQPELEGVWQVSSDPISKYALLALVNEALGLRVTIERDESFTCDRSLDSGRFRARTGFTPPGWPEMIRALAEDPTPYPAP